MDIENLKLVYAPDEILEQAVEEVDIANPGFDLVALRDKMVSIMLDSNGVGLAANQVGLNKKIFVMGNNNERASMFINPQVVEVTKEQSLEHEGCLSFPGIFVKVSRPLEIGVRFYDENLQEQQVKLEGYVARIFLHEYDHMLGITMKDRVSKMKWDRAVTKKAKIKKRIFS